MTTMKTTMTRNGQVKEVMKQFVYDMVGEYYSDFYKHLYHKRVVPQIYDNLETIYKTLSDIHDEYLRVDYIHSVLYDFCSKVDVKAEFKMYMKNLIKGMNKYVSQRGLCPKGTDLHTLLKLQVKFDFVDIPEEVIDEVLDKEHPNVYGFMNKVMQEHICPHDGNELKKIEYFVNKMIVEPYHSKVMSKEKVGQLS